MRFALLAAAEYSCGMQVSVLLHGDWIREGLTDRMHCQLANNQRHKDGACTILALAQ